MLVAVSGVQFLQSSQYGVIFHNVAHVNPLREALSIPYAIRYCSCARIASRRYASQRRALATLTLVCHLF